MDTTVSQDELQTVLEQLNMTADDPDLYRVLIGANLEATALVDAIELPEPEIPERKWWRPIGEDNPLGAWYVRTDIRGATGGSHDYPRRLCAPGGRRDCAPPATRWGDNYGEECLRGLLLFRWKSHQRHRARAQPA